MDILVKTLNDENLTVSSAESLTGGLFAQEITSISGASKVFKGSLVCYDSEVKYNVLGVPRVLCKNNGVISRECASEMSLRIKKLMDTDIGISFTGNAGPSVMEGKSVGEVYMCINITMYDITKIIVKHKIFPGNRDDVRKKCISYMIDNLISLILKFKMFKNKCFTPGNYHANNITDVVNNVQKFLSYVTNMQGVIYGGYIRDILVPLIKNFKIETLNFEDVDIWWRSQQDLDKFIDLFLIGHDKYKIIKVNTNLSNKILQYKCYENYKWSITQYYLHINDIGVIAILNCVVSDKFPVNDFVENHLVCESIDANKIILRSRHNICQVTENINYISDKRLYPMKGYNISENRCKRFKEKGYKMNDTIPRHVDSVSEQVGTNKIEFKINY